MALSFSLTVMNPGAVQVGSRTGVRIDTNWISSSPANFYLTITQGQATLLNESQQPPYVGASGPYAGKPYVSGTGSVWFYVVPQSTGTIVVSVVGVPISGGVLQYDQQSTQTATLGAQQGTCIDVSPMFKMSYPGTEIDAVVPITVTFTYTGFNADATGVTFTWDFGDGTPAGTGKSVTHTYNVASPNNGAQPYIPKLTTYNPCVPPGASAPVGSKGPFDQGYRIYARPTGYIPPPVTICNPPGSCAAGSVTCVNGVSYLCGSDGCFIPGGNACGVTPPPPPPPPPPGTTAPTANFYADAVSGVAPLTVNFVDTSTGSPTSRQWNFGDGTTDVTASPTHTFVNAGNYYVTLTATNAGGSTSKTTLITVTSGNGGTPPPSGGIQLPAWLNAQNALIAAVLLGGAGIAIITLKRRRG